MNSTAIFIIVVLAVVFIYDGWLLRKGYTNTISWTLYNSSRKWLIIPFLFGVLAGHLWFPIFGRDGENLPCQEKPIEVKK